MAATPEVPHALEEVPHALEKDALQPAPGRKPWQTPRFIVSEVVADTQYSSDPPTNDGPYSQLS